MNSTVHGTNRRKSCLQDWGTWTAQFMVQLGWRPANRKWVHEQHSSWYKYTEVLLTWKGYMNSMVHGTTRPKSCLQERGIWTAQFMVQLGWSPAYRKGEYEQHSSCRPKSYLHERGRWRAWCQQGSDQSRCSLLPLPWSCPTPACCLPAYTKAQKKMQKIET